ncbi:MAG: 4'-phosphopantetheinyl transferase superfamily protein [Anaerolineae bacterium]
MPVCLTISHCEEWALCAVIALDSRQATSGPAASAGQAPPAIGVDIERVRPRDWNFVETFFTEAEIRQVQTAPPAWRDTLITAIWSAKEAALKVVKLGLTVDTRRVDCVCNLDRAPDDDWLPLQVTYHPATAAAAEIMPGWWTTRDGFVLTLAFSQNMA